MDVKKNKNICANVTGNVGPPSCVDQATQWMVTQEQVGKVKDSALFTVDIFYNSTV